MVIMFQGTHTSNNCVTGAAATSAVLSAIKFNRKTLMIQLTGTGRTEMQMLLEGQQIEESRLVAEANALRRINDRGIDALMRRAEAAKLVKEHFDSSCEPLLEAKKATENMLDIAGITEKEDFIETIQVDTVNTILKHAKEVYDNIFILLDGKNETVMKDILSLADVTVTCIGQSAKIEKYNQYDKVRNIILVTDYEPTSAYSLHYLKNQYHVKHVYSFPHNIGYKDACISGTLLDFLMKNYNVTNNDDNFDYIKNVLSLMDGIMGKEKWDEIDDKNTEMDVPEDVKKEELESCDTVQVTKQTVKKGLFSKKTVIQVTDDSDVPNDDELEEDSEGSLEMDPEDDENDNGEEEENMTKNKEKHSLFGKKKKLPQMKLPKQEYVSEKAGKTTITKSSDAWTCPECGEENNGNFCNECGAKRPEVKKPESTTWICPECGEENTGKFCSECGSKKPESKEWICPYCGIENTGKFCSECGTKR